MLKAIQIIGSSSGFVSNRLKSNCSHGGLSFSSVSTKQSSSSSIPTASLMLPLAVPARQRGCFRPFNMSAARAESNSVGASSSSSSSPSVVTTQPSGSTGKIKFCQWCGGPTKHEIPDGEERTRAVCTLCGEIAYQNPKMVVGCLIEHDNKVLLCKRNIQPSYGLWTLPAGYMEIGESAIEGAIRETSEEAGAEVEILSPFAQLDIPLIGQTYIIFLAKMKTPHFSPGPESIECRLFPLDDIPFDSLAFSSMLVTLELYIEDMKAGEHRFHYGTINKRPGTSPSDIRAFTLDYHMQS